MKMGEQKFLKVWTGVISGSMGGREDGYPETEMAIVSLDSLARGFGSKREEEYFLLEEMPLISVEKIAYEAMDRINLKEKEEKEAKIKSEIKALQKQLEDLR